MKIKITTFNCLAWEWAKKHRTIQAFVPEVAKWTKEEWISNDLDDYQLPGRYENYIKFFLKEKGFFCLQEVDHALALLISRQDGIFVVCSNHGFSYYSTKEIGNMMIYIEDGTAGALHNYYHPKLFSVMFRRSDVVCINPEVKICLAGKHKPYNLTQINVCPGKTFWLLNIHAPGFNRFESEEASKVGVERIIEYLRKIITDNDVVATLGNVIITGDFNIDVKRSWSGFRVAEYLEQYNLSYYPNNSSCCEVITEPSTESTIDYIWVNEEVIKEIDPEEPITVQGSDHKAVSISFWI